MNISSKKKPKNIVLLRRAEIPGSPKKLFFVHDGTGRIEGYFRIVQHIHKEFALYGITPIIPGREKTALIPRYTSITEIAEHYRAAINHYIGDEPVFIAGWSTGGYIAFEMAYRLQEEGRSVKFLALLDVMPPSTGSNERRDSIAGECRFIFPFINNESLKEKLEKTNGIESFWNLVQSELDEADFDREKFMQENEGGWGRILPHYHGLELHDLFFRINTFRGYYRIGLEYNPPVNTSTPLHYFHASNSVIKAAGKWNDYCNEFFYHKVPGEHYTMLSPPHSIQFSEVFNQVLCTFKDF